MKKYVLDLEVMTSVFIGNGKDLLLNIDLVLGDDGKAYLIDWDKILEKIPLQHIIRFLDRGAGNISTMLSDYGVSPAEVSSQVIPVLYPISGETAGRTRKIKDHITLNNVPVVPGSSVKGVVRTSVLNNLVMLTNNEKLNRTIKESIESIIHGKKKKKRKDLKNTSSRLEEEFLKVKIPLGDNDYLLDILKFIQVSDPISINPKPALDAVIVAKKTGFPRPVVTVPVIALGEKSRFRFEMNIYDLPPKGAELSPKLEKLYRETVAKISDYLKKYSIMLIDFEKNIYGHIGGSGSSFASVLEEWRKEVEENNNTYYVKIGGYCGHYSKTIFLSLDDNLRRKLQVNMSKIRRRSWDTKTLKLVGSKYIVKRIVPFGWVRLTLEEA